MFTAPKRPLPFPLDRAANLERVVPEGLEICGLPEFPEDSDEQITVLFRLSLNQFVALATAIDVGSDIAYGDDGIPVWYLWMASVMCAAFCEEMGDCLENQDPYVMYALERVIMRNPAIQRAIAAAAAGQGAPVPGTELPPTTRAENSLPENVKDEMGECDYNALWGAVTGLVQYGNRAITDFFEIVESASNAIERAAIATGAIPAAGTYIATAAEFADQFQEEMAEAYAAAYTETYEQQLACALFCFAREECEISIDQIISVLVNRLGTSDPADFLELMNFIISGTFVGDEIPDMMFLLFFTAIKFGTEFAGTISVRALTVQMGLGADLLASDNWIALCDCPEFWFHEFPDENVWAEFTPLTYNGATTTEVGDKLIGATNTANDAVFLSYEITVDAIVTEVVFRLEYDEPADDQLAILYIDNVNVAQIELNDPSGEMLLEWTGFSSGSHTYKVLAGVFGTIAMGRYLNAKSGGMGGDGTDPFI